MACQPGFFDVDDRLRWLNEAGDPLARLAAVVDFAVFRECRSAWKVDPLMEWAPGAGRSSWMELTG